MVQAGNTVLGKWFSSWRKVGSLGELGGLLSLDLNFSQLSLTIVLGSVGKEKLVFQKQPKQAEHNTAGWAWRTLEGRNEVSQGCTVANWRVATGLPLHRAGVGTRSFPPSRHVLLWKGTASLTGHPEARTGTATETLCGSEAWQALDLEKEATNFLLLRFLREVHHSFSREKNQNKQKLKNQPNNNKKQALKSQTGFIKRRQRELTGNVYNLQRRTNTFPMKTWAWEGRVQLPSQPSSFPGDLRALGQTLRSLC